MQSKNQMAGENTSNKCPIGLKARGWMAGAAILSLGLLFHGIAISTLGGTPATANTPAIRAKLEAIPMTEKVNLTEQEWKAVLSPESYRVLRQAGTEPPFTNKYAKSHEKGTFVCAGCGNPLFDSETKFESGTGWPSFYQPIRKDAVEIKEDRSHGMVREEAVCARCGGHLGHVFNDGPKPTGLRYCMNSASLDLKTEKK